MNFVNIKNVFNSGIIIIQSIYNCLKDMTTNFLYVLGSSAISFVFCFCSFLVLLSFLLHFSFRPFSSDLISFSTSSLSSISLCPCRVLKRFLNVSCCIYSIKCCHSVVSCLYQCVCVQVYFDIIEIFV